MTADLASVCGIYCGSCEYLEGRCPGCVQVKGQPFWTEHVGTDTCRLYQCCVGERDLEHCGMCEDLPCDMFKTSYDPSLSPEEAVKDVGQRQESLRLRRDIGTLRWVKEQDNPAAR